MTRKGGGRESDEVVQGNAPPRQADVGTLSAAANPAARPLLQCPVGLDGAYHSCCQQVRALEAELEKNRRQHLVEMDRQTDRLIHADSRAETAEACVKELESGERFTETMFRKLEKAGWKFDELRGEDSG